MSNSSIWVLIAGDKSAAICSSSEGTSQLLREVTPENAQHGAVLMAGQAKRAFAWELMSELCRGAQSQSYDGVIIVAAQEMMDELRRVVMPTVCKFVIAEIVGTPDWSMV